MCPRACERNPSVQLRLYCKAKVFETIAVYDDEESLILVQPYDVPKVSSEWHVGENRPV